MATVPELAVTIIRGFTFRLKAQFKTADDIPLDLTTKRVQFVYKRKTVTGVVITSDEAVNDNNSEIIMLDAANGQIELILGDEETEAIQATSDTIKGHYWFSLLDPDGHIYTLLHGDADVINLEAETNVTTPEVVVDVVLISEQGPTGPQGEQGIQGEQGETGEIGPIGPQGIQGETGPQGEQGDPGPQGIQGIQGPIGLTGPQGEQGEEGDPGPQGIQGIQGPIGLTGPQGEQGDPGPQGIQGIPGPQGIQGNVGPQGDVGPQGIQGVPGPEGDVGPQGEQGDVGPQGIQGDVGPAGPAPKRIKDQFRIYQDFVGIAAANDQWGTVSTGLAPIAQEQPTGDAIGVAQVSCLSDAVGMGSYYAREGRDGINLFKFNNGLAWYFAVKTKLGDLGSAAINWTNTIGFTNELIYPAHFVGFKYCYSVNGGKWQAICMHNSSPTVVDTGVAAQISSFILLEVEVNLTGTEAKFYINRNLVATITTNIPSNTALMTFMVHYYKVDGAGVAKLSSLDFIEIIGEGTR